MKCLPCEIHVNDSEAYFTGEVQLVNYLIATGKPVGQILNFGERKVEMKRKVKDMTEAINRMKNNQVNPVILSNMTELLPNDPTLQFKSIRI